MLGMHTLALRTARVNLQTEETIDGPVANASRTTTTIPMRAVGIASTGGAVLAKCTR